MTVVAIAMAPSSMLVAQTMPAGSHEHDAMTGASGKGVGINLGTGKPAEPAPVPAYKPAAPVANGAAPANAVKATTTAAATGTLNALKACDRPLGNTAVRFADAAGFDRSLRAKLRGGRSVGVDIASPYRAGDEAPAPLSAWLNEVKASGGSVSVKPYCHTGSKGFGQFFANLFGGRPADPYKAARKYDATLYVDALDQKVTQVEFTRRKAGQ